MHLIITIMPVLNINWTMGSWFSPWEMKPVEWGEGKLNVWRHKASLATAKMELEWVAPTHCDLLMTFQKIDYIVSLSHLFVKELMSHDSLCGASISDPYNNPLG